MNKNEKHNMKSKLHSHKNHVVELANTKGAILITLYNDEVKLSTKGIDTEEMRDLLNLAIHDSFLMEEEVEK